MDFVWNCYVQMCFCSFRMLASFKRHKEKAYLHSGIKPEQSAEKPSAASFALSQTSWVANGEGGAPAMAVGFLREVVLLPHPFLFSQ